MTQRRLEGDALAIVGLRRHASDVDHDEADRLQRINRELRNGFRALQDVGPAVSVFGSARLGEDTPEYRETREVCRRIALAGHGVITGGGPGLMEAANRGARDGGGLSVGVNIELLTGQHANAYLDRRFECRHFFVRKLLFVRYALAFLIFPGGFGTLDEAFEALTLVQTHKIPNFPVLFFGGEFWRDMEAHLDRMQKSGLIDEGERKMVRMVGGVDEALEILRECRAERPWEANPTGRRA